MTQQSLALLAPAKINLGLEILRRRPDGFHDLNTLFATLRFGDRLFLGSRGDRQITCSVSGADLPADASNLAVRAALRLRERLGIEAGLDIVIEKRIPMGAGLGGGSSDAAVVLNAAPFHWGVDAPAPLLHEIALELGSDVPFFLVGGLARAGSRGERLEPLRLRLPWYVLLVNPGIHVSTPAGFAAVGRRRERQETDLVAALEAALTDPSSLQRTLVNDFEPAIVAMHPEIGRLKERLIGAGALYASMSGSGSTLYGLFDTLESAREAEKRFDDCWSTATGFLPLAP